MTDKTNARAELPIVLFGDQAAWAGWLEHHQAEAPGLWLRHAKKGSGLASVSYAEALDVALCYGWIDGQKKSYDDLSWIQRWTPRGAKSIWSKINCGHIQRLIECNQMRPAGLAAVERAKQDGRWDAAYDSHSTATVPSDLQAALDSNAAASAFFATLNSTNRYAILFRIQTAKKPETRAKRIQQFIDMLTRQEKMHP